MKIYYDLATRNINFEGLGRFFGSGSMEAVTEGDYVYVQYIGSQVKEIYELYTVIQKEDGSPAGVNPTEVVVYLNEEFSKGIIMGQSSFSLLSATITVVDSRIRSNNKIITQPIGAVNEVLGVTVSNGAFTVTRTVISVVSGLTNNLVFEWVRF